MAKNHRTVCAPASRYLYHRRLKLIVRTGPGSKSGRSTNSFAAQVLLLFRAHQSVPFNSASRKELIARTYIRRVSAKRAMSQQRFPYVTTLKGNFNKKERRNTATKNFVTHFVNCVTFNLYLTRITMDRLKTFSETFHPRFILRLNVFSSSLKETLALSVLKIF